MDDSRGNVYLCGSTALAIWQWMRGAWRPRLDYLVPISSMYESIGMAPAHVESITASAVRPDEARARFRTAVASLRLPKRPATSGDVASRNEKSPVELMVGRPEDRRRGGVVCHVWAGPMPPGAFVALPGGVFVATPELVFLQLARKANLPSLVLLGYEMCGAYSSGRFGGWESERCAPLTSAGRLASFLDASDGSHGVLLARRALRLIADRSASAGETAMVILACAPRMLGGYGLPFPSLNFQVNLSARQRALLKRRRLFLDAFWPEARFDLEYDGSKYHSSPDDLARNRRRDNALALTGITAVHMDKRMLFSASQFNDTARQAAKAIAYRLPAKAFGAEWVRRRDELREAVLPRDSDQQADDAAS